VSLGSVRAVGFAETEIEAWLTKQIAQRSPKAA
jgi:predicted DNA-binding transcriptional regulator AlpA